MNDQALTVVPTTEIDRSPAGMMAVALANNQDLEKIEKLLDLQIKWEENEAKKAYHKAMAAFKANPPDIEKDKTVGFKAKKPGASDTSYQHASLHNVTTKINAAMAPHGLHAAWKVEQIDGNIKVTCTISHELGHSESTSLFAGSDNSGNKNSIQAIGSTITYLERYTLLALTGLGTKDMDDDGVGSEPIEYITGEDLATIKKLVSETKSNNAKFWKFAGADNIDTIPVDNLNKVLAALNQKKVTLSKKETLVDDSVRQPGEEG